MAIIWLSCKVEKDQPYSSITYKQALADVNGLGTALINRGLKNKRIGIIGETCYQWESSYLATLNGTGIVVPLDKELSAKELEHDYRSRSILRHLRQEI